MSNELIKAPNCLITLLRMDEEGHMWFQCEAPMVYIQDQKQSFPARLHFFRKGFNYFIDVNGSASIVNTTDHYETTDDSKNKPVLLKLNVNNIEYTEPESKKKTWLNECLEKSYNWIMHHLNIPSNQKSFFTKLQHYR